MGGHAAVPHRTPPPPERKARPDRRGTGLRPVLTPGDGARPRTCIVASGVAFAHASELLDTLGPEGRIDLYQVRLAYPLHKPFIEEIRKRYEKVLVLEETDAVIEMQLGPGGVSGRGSGDVPRQGELTPDVIEEILRKFLDLPAAPAVSAAKKGIRPSLCAGCGHRAAFYAIRETFPAGIFPSDIGCYTLGMNFGAVDTCHCMGACIGQGAGFYHAYAAGGNDFPTIVVTIGDSTFFHAGIPGLINAVFQGARFILVILDNATTAMTGHQPTPQLGVRADGSAGTEGLHPRPRPGLRRPAPPGDRPLRCRGLHRGAQGGGLLHPVAGGRHRRPHRQAPLHREPGGAPGAGRIRDEHHGRLRRLPGLHRRVRMPGHPV